MPLDSFGRSELHYAALEGDLRAVDRLIAEGADVNLADGNGWTPLHAAAQSRQTDVALPIGVGVNTGRAWMGAVGQGSSTELTALGDAVNTASRLAARAGPGELLVSADAAKAADLDPKLEPRSLELKGKELATEVVTLTVGSA